MPKIQRVYLTRQKGTSAKKNKKQTPSKFAKSKESISIKKANKSKKTLTNNNVRKAKKRRNRKSYDEMVVLNKCFKDDPNWGRETVQFLKKTLGLKTAQIYKWGYDRKKLAEKENIDAEYSKSSGKSKHDVYMTDRHINDYNDAVLKICDSISKHPSKEGLVRKEEVSESCQNSLKSTEPNKDNKTKRKIFSNANTHSATLSELSEIVPSKPLEMDNRTENEDMICLTSEKLELKDEVEEIIIDDSDYIEESWNELHSDDTYNYIKLHCDEYNQIIPPNNYGFINAEELEQSIIDCELSSEAEFAMNRMDDLYFPKYNMDFDAC